MIYRKWNCSPAHKHGSSQVTTNRRLSSGEMWKRYNAWLGRNNSLDKWEGPVTDGTLISGPHHTEYERLQKVSLEGTLMIRFVGILNNIMKLQL